MGFKLNKSHNLAARSKKIKYYTLGNFGVYEEISTPNTATEGKQAGEKQKFISWTPWGIDFEVNSVKELSKAYSEFMKYNPDVAIN
ncbi:hypothetical protein [Rubrolithibacter danxiaensis]|uniref:hypothetical protein n=1 Tax=Rubrolithibacter danxiaensis TaxID=3390805 RepID=UPI003BF8F868